MKLCATKEIRVFIDKKTYGSKTKLEFTNVGKIPVNKRENLSWKGCYYTIEVGEYFYFDRSNNWDICYFVLSNGAEFVTHDTSPKTFIEINSVTIC